MMNAEQLNSDTTPPGRREDREGNLSACDTCYQRKIKCDRRSPCANCQDANISCRRLRPKQKRKPRENVTSKLKETREEMEARMMTLENTITGLMAGPKEASVGGTPDSSTSDTQASNRQDSNKPTSLPINKKWNAFKEPTYSTPPYSTVEAQQMIEQELRQGEKLSKQKREAFHAALGSLSESLATSHHDPTTALFDSFKAHVEAQKMEVPKYPEIETIKWLITPGMIETQNAWALPDTLPVVTRQTISQMALNIQDEQGRKDNPAAVVCVCSMVAHFLLEHLITQEPSILDTVIRAKVAAYFATAQEALSQINLLAAPSLDNLQAFIFGSVNAQEAGHPIESWRYNVAACNLCIAFNLHKNVSAFTNGTDEDLMQAKYCFLVCYLNDKGLAMNLGKPPCLPDNYIEVDLRKLKPPSDIAKRQYIQNYILELAFAQSRIVELQYSIKRLSPDKLHETVTEIVADLDRIWAMIEKLPEDMAANSTQDDIDYEVRMGKFSYYTIKTILFHGCTDNINTSIYREPSLEAARLSMHQMQNMDQRQQEYKEYKSHSFAHWSVLYYPFTSFFVLFCNVVSKKNLQDYELMLAFVDYLVGVKANSAPIAKLHNLCLPFCALASTALKSTDDPVEIRPNKRARLKESTQQAQVMTQPAPSLQQPPTPKQVRQIEQQILPEQSLLAPMGGLDNNVAFEFNNDVLAQFMDFQPRLQWLDTDFSAFEQTWGTTGFTPGPDTSNDHAMSGNGFL